MKEKKHELTTGDIAVLIGVAMAHVVKDFPEEERDQYTEFAAEVAMAIKLHLDGKEPFPKEEIEMCADIKAFTEVVEPCKEEGANTDESMKKYELTEHDIDKFVCLAVERTLNHDAPDELAHSMMEFAAVISQIINSHLNGADPFDEQALKRYDRIASLLDGVLNEDEEGEDEQSN